MKFHAVCIYNLTYQYVVATYFKQANVTLHIVKHVSRYYKQVDLTCSGTHKTKMSKVSLMTHVAMD